MGDPETEVVIPRIKSDLVALFEAVASEKLIDFNLDIDSKTAATIVVVSGGYPEEFEKGKQIFGLDTKTESLIFHAGTKEENGKIVSNGGRVLAVTSFGDTFSTATKKSYQTIENLKFDKMNYRKDIGFDL
jgi:phosphoribosylamine--glycine ligase